MSVSIPVRIENLSGRIPDRMSPGRPSRRAPNECRAGRGPGGARRSHRTGRGFSLIEVAMASAVVGFPESDLSWNQL